MIAQADFIKYSVADQNADKVWWLPGKLSFYIKRSLREIHVTTLQVTISAKE